MRVDFDRRNPFPLLDIDLLSTAVIKEHSRQVDQSLSYRVVDIERELMITGVRSSPRSPSQLRGQNLWIGLDPQDLMTPYLELRWLLESVRLQPGFTVVDFGAAYGRMAHVINRHWPDVDFIGYEYVGERVKEAQRVFNLRALAQARMEQVDLASATFSPPEAEVYFIYDFGSREAMNRILYSMQKQAALRDFTIIARGRNSRYLIETEHRWLQASTRVERRFSIYQNSREGHLALNKAPIEYR